MALDSMSSLRSPLRSKCCRATRAQFAVYEGSSGVRVPPFAAIEIELGLLRA